MARWTGPIQMQELPDELLEDEHGELRVVRNTTRKAASKSDLAAAETARCLLYSVCDNALAIYPVMLPALASALSHRVSRRC